MAVTTTVRAFKRHRCDGPAGIRAHNIEPGDRYQRTVVFPNDINTSGKPWVFRTCAPCAATAGAH